MDLPVSRRTFVAGLAGTVGGIWLTAHARSVLAAGEHVARRTATGQQTFRVLTLADALEIEAAAAQIIPSDGTHGAREARVVHFIDRALETFASADKNDFISLAAELRTRAAAAGARSFAALPDRQQIQLLQQMEKDSKDHFERLRSTTIVGMFANPSYGGNYEKGGWKLLGFTDRFSWAAPFGSYDK